MEKQLTTVCSKLSNMDERMDNLEGRQKTLENEVKANTSLSSSSVCTPEPRPRVRRRVTPTSLQVDVVMCRNVKLLLSYLYFSLEQNPPCSFVI